MMKKMLRKLTAALLALCCVPVTGLTAAAEFAEPYYQGSVDWDAFAGMEPVNSRGWDGDWYGAGDDVTVYLDDAKGAEGLYLVTPRTNDIRFVLREDADWDAAVDEIAQVLDVYYPGLHDALNTEYYDRCGARQYLLTTESGDVRLYQYEAVVNERLTGGRVIDLSVPEVPESAQEMEAEVLLSLAKRRILSGFYGFGETAYYLQSCHVYGPLDEYESCYHVVNENYTDWTDYILYIPYDWDAVQAYLDVEYPGYTVETYQGAEYQCGESPDGVSTISTTRYRIVPTGELTFREEMELAFELWEKFHLDVHVGFEEAEGDTTTGHNALEKPGDVTLDTELDIMDVIAVNKALLGSATLCDTAAKNADINGDGTPDETDSLAILKAVVGITEGLS